MRHKPILDVTRPDLSALLNEGADLSPEMALRIEKAFGVSHRGQKSRCPTKLRPPPPTFGYQARYLSPHDYSSQAGFSIPSRCAASRTTHLVNANAQASALAAGASFEASRDGFRFLGNVRAASKNSWPAMVGRVPQSVREEGGAQLILEVTRPRLSVDYRMWRVSAA
jgi:hypothetical protein